MQLGGGDAFVATAARFQSETMLAGSRTVVVSFPITDDALDEPDTTVTATIGAHASGAYELGTPIERHGDDCGRRPAAGGGAGCVYF